MAKVTFALVGNMTSRDATNTLLYGSSQKDQYFSNCHWTVNDNQVSGKRSVYVSGRQEFTTGPYPTTSSGAGTAIQLWEGSNGQRVTAFGNTNSTIFVDDTNVGTITGQAKFIDETIVSDVTTMFLTSTDDSGWYLPVDAFSVTGYTGNTNSNTTVNNIASTAGMYSGQAISGSGIPAGTRIASVDSSTSITLTAAATATATGVTLTKTPIAKILDADYPGNAGINVVGRAAPLDGYLFLMGKNGKVYNPSVNSLINWVATDVIPTQEYPDVGSGCMRYKNFIVAFSRHSVEYFYNAGNSSGSPLGRVQSSVMTTGCFQQYAMCYWMGSIAYVGMESGVWGIYVISGQRLEKISTQQIDDALQANPSSNIRLNVMESYGTSRLVLSIAAPAKNNYAFDPVSRTWSLLVLTHAITQSAVSFGNNSIGVTYVGNDSTKYIESTDSVASGSLQIGPLTESNKPVEIKSIGLIGDQAVSTLNLSISLSFDDGQSFGSSRLIDVSKNRQTIYRCGRGRRPMLKITGLSGVSNRPHRLSAIVVDMEESSVGG